MLADNRASDYFRNCLRAPDILARKSGNMPERRSSLAATAWPTAWAGCQAWGRRMARLVFPPCCAACASDLPQDSDDSDTTWVCKDCLDRLQIGRLSRCPRCAAALPGAGEATGACQECESGKWRFDLALALGNYSGDLRSMVLRMKQSREEPLRRSMAEVFWRQFGETLTAWRPDVALPIPMHWTRRWARGVNCPEVLSGLLAKRLGASHAPAAARRHRRTLPQGGLTRTARRRNVRGAFSLGRGIDWRGARVLLVDDVLTTGSTCGELARILLRAGAEAVAVGVVARAQSLDGAQR